MIRSRFSIALFCAGIWTILSLQAPASESWHVEGDPKAIAQEIPLAM
jgi:hypothetical protein